MYVHTYIFCVTVWLGSVVVREMDLQLTGRGFESRPPHCRVTTIWRYRNLSNLN